MRRIASRSRSPIRENRRNEDQRQEMPEFYMEFSEKIEEQHEQAQSERRMQRRPVIEMIPEPQAYTSEERRLRENRMLRRQFALNLFRGERGNNAFPAVYEIEGWTILSVNCNLLIEFQYWENGRPRENQRGICAPWNMLCKYMMKEDYARDMHEKLIELVKTKLGIENTGVVEYIDTSSLIPLMGDWLRDLIPEMIDGIGIEDDKFVDQIENMEQFCKMKQKLIETYVNYEKLEMTWRLIGELKHAADKIVEECRFENILDIMQYFEEDYTGWDVGVFKIL